MWSAPGYSGERHEGKDAQERRKMVVFVEGQKQQHKICNFLFFLCFSEVVCGGCVNYKKEHFLL